LVVSVDLSLSLTSYIFLNLNLRAFSSFRQKISADISYHSQNGGAGDGMTWASILHNALVNNNCSGYLYWVGTQWGNTNEKMIKIDDTTKDVQISKRVWAFAQYSRYIRPGAMRVAATGAPNGVSASAFVNEGVSGSLVVPVLNTGTGSQAITVKVGGGFVGASVTAWITDNSRESK